MKKEMRLYAKTHDMVILGFRLDAGRQPYGMAIKEIKNPIDKSLFCFGRLYHVFGHDFAFDQCGTNCFESEMEVRKHAYAFFGIK